jgi:protein SFI1
MHEIPRQERGRSTSTHGSLRITRRSPSRSDRNEEPPASPSGADTGFSTVATSHDRQQKLDSLNAFRGQRIGHESHSLMQTKASLVLQHHLSLSGKRHIELWRVKAIKAREHNANLESLARQKDKSILLNLAWDSWRNLLLERRHIAETEQFFVHLERRSEQARNLYLLHKAFTHWGTSAFEAVERTSIARRHIIKTRTFNAWRDITAVNELKVRRQVIKKFFTLWRRQHIHLSSDDAKSITIYESNLAEKVFRQWLRLSLGIRATAWLSQNTKLKAVSRWVSLSQSAEARRRTVDKTRALQLTRNTWEVWRAKTHDRIRHDIDATAFNYARICTGALRKWRRETRVLPAKKTLQTDVNLRAVRQAFSVWLQRTRQEQQAATIDRLRITREAWTNWRHKLRYQVLRVRVDDHVILRSIYKWVLTERSIVAQRLISQRPLLDCLRNWTRKTQILRERRWDQESLAQSVVVHKRYDFALRSWHSRLQAQKQQSIDATNMYVPRRLENALSQWWERTRHVQELERWSHDAEFYFLASKTLKRWKVSTEAAKREKRKAAYVQVRRTKKMKLAGGVLVDWRSQAQEILALHSQALEFNQNRTVILGMNIFDQWRARMEELEELNSLWRERVLRKQFSLWRGRATAFRDLEVVAIINFQERQQDRAIKKWGLFSLQVRSQSRYAAEIRDKNLKRSFRKSFTYWHQRAVQKRPPKSSDHDGQDLVGSTPRGEIWSESGDDTEVDEWARGLDEASMFTPVPGYLKTPSKRLERVTAAAARFSSTTPRAPLPSPFDRRTRGRYFGSSLSSIRQGGASSLGADFEDIAETSNDEIHGFM